MAADDARTVGWKRWLRFAGALALPAIAVLGFGAATVQADGPPRCGGGPDRVAHEGCGDGDRSCERDGDCDRDHDRGGRLAATPRASLRPTPMPDLSPASGEAPVGPALVAAVPSATSPRSPGRARVALAGAVGAAAPPAESPAESSAVAPASPATPAATPSPAGVLPVSLPPVRPAPALVDLPLVRLLVIAVVVGVAAAVLPRAVRWPR